jgi:type VI secretion system FHA domain protein
MEQKGVPDPVPAYAFGAGDTAPADDVWGKLAASNTVDWARGGFGAAAAPAAADWAAPAAPPALSPVPSSPVAVAAGLAPAAPAPLPPAPAPGPAGGDAAWSAFLAASGVSPGDLKAPPAQAAASAGALLKKLIAGMVVMLEARARAKSQLGAQSTTLEFDGNNPLKFARSPERVLAQLMNPPERGFMAPERAIDDSFQDLQAHQMATLAAMQGALRSTLDRFSPEAIRQRAETRGVIAKILQAPATRPFGKPMSASSKASRRALTRPSWTSSRRPSKRPTTRLRPK